MAIFYPQITENVIGGKDVTIQSVSGLNSFIQEVASQKYKLSGVTIIASSFDQLQQSITFEQNKLNGHHTVKSQMPKVDAYQSVAVLKNVSSAGFVLDGLSSIKYDVLPNSDVKFILSLNKNKGSGEVDEDLIEAFKEEVGAIDTIDYVAAQNPELIEQLYGEQEEEEEKSIPELLSQINNHPDHYLETDLLEEYENQAEKRMDKVEEEENSEMDPKKQLNVNKKTVKKATSKAPNTMSFDGGNNNKKYFIIGIGLLSLAALAYMIYHTYNENRH